MKKFIPVFLSIVLVVLSLCAFAGCNIYQVPENHCIVGLYREYQLYSDSEGQLCEPINKRIKGIKREYSTNYYSVVKGALYSIVCNDFIDDGEGFGYGLNDYDIASAWWQGHIITSFVKTYSEKSGLQDETFFKTNYGQVTTEVKVVFSQNCIVKTTSEPYLYVGGVFEILGKDSSYLDSHISNYLNEFGIINEKDGFNYLLLNDEVCIHQDAWKTNFDITDYKYEYIDGGWNRAIQAQFTVKPPVVNENEKLFLHIICRTYSGKYFVYPLTYVGAQGFTMPIREHELKLTFEK